MNNLEKSAERSLRVIGYWNNKIYPQYNHYPNPADFVDENWEAEYRDKVVEYLDNAVLYNIQRGISMCRICKGFNGSKELTDGVFFWPEGLSHYVKEHAVRLPQHFVQHCLSYKYDKEEVQRTIDDRFRDGLGLIDHREDWWCSYKSPDKRELVNWKIEPNIYEDEENIIVAVGFWEGDDNPLGETSYYPHPKHFVNIEWSEEDKKKVIEYMKSCTVVTSEALESHDKCLLTGKDLSNRVFCDGYFIFPENYIYYIEEQNVRPVNYFVNHCLKHTNTWKDDIASEDYIVEVDYWEDFKVY